jgi:PST family polysaccharide transporter
MQQDRERMLRAFYMGTKYASYIAFPIFIGLAVTASEVIPVVFGPQWTPSVPVMQVLAFIGLLHSVTFFNGGVIMAMGKPSWRLMLNAINAVTNVVAFLIAVRWGIVAVAAAYVIRSYVTAPITPWVIRKLIGLSFSQYLRQFAIPLAGSLALAASILLLHNLVGSTISPKVLLIMEVGLGAVVYLAAIQLMAPSMLQNVVGLARQVKTMKV